MNNGSLSPYVHAATAVVQADNISVNPSFVLAQNWHDEAIQTSVLVGRRFCGHGRFCFGRDPDASQCGCSGEMVGNMKELGQGTSSEGLDIGSPYTARHMAG